MAGNIKQYLAGIAPAMPAEIISEDTYSRIYNMADRFSDFAASEYIMETNLDSENTEADFSFRVLDKEKACLVDGLSGHNFRALAADATWNRIISFVNFWPQDIDDIWLEMDYGEYEKQVPQPCFFFNATQVVKGSQIDDQLFYGALEHLLDRNQLPVLWPRLKQAFQYLPPDVGLFQVGVMLARSSNQIRVFTNELTREQVFNYLADINWTGSFPQLEELFQLVHAYSDGQYILDFDISDQGVSEKIGINFGLKDYKQTLPAFLENLINRQICTDVKRRGVLAWNGSKGSFLGPDYGYSALIRNISHFKASCLPDQDIKVKAYLRIAGVYLKELFKAPAAATQMNEPQEGNMKNADYKGMQDTIKKIAQQAALDPEYRKLCLQDSRAAIQAWAGTGTRMPDNIVFIEEDQEVPPDEDVIYYILPPFFKPNWLTGK